MGLEIVEVTTKNQLKDFIYLPEKIHKNHKNWLFPLYMDDVNFFNKDKNRLFKHNRVKLWNAYTDGKIAGRIMGVIPDSYNQIHKENNIRFSFLECYKDFEVFKNLLLAVESWGKSNFCTGIIGPMGFSDKDPQGFLIEGFDEPTVMVTNCSFDYMPEFCEMAGLSKKLDLVEYRFPLDNQFVDRLKPFAERAEKYQEIRVLEFTNTRQVKPYIVPVFTLINQTYRHIYGFAPFDDKEMNEFANRFLPLLDARLIKLILNRQGEVLAFVIAMADLSKGINAAKGRLLPFGWLKILLAGKKSDYLVLLLGAIHEDYRNKGLDAILGLKLFESAKKQGFKNSDSHVIMESNIKMRAEIERIDGHKMYKKYRIYEKMI